MDNFILIQVIGFIFFGKYQGDQMKGRDKGCRAMDWDDLPQDRVHWRAVVKKVMNLYSMNGGNLIYWLCDCLAAQERLWSLELI
jgi:hypothetical protein